jgi:hypothetical protein
MVRRASPGRSALSEVITIILLVLGVWILNLISAFYGNPIFIQIVEFFNVNLIFLIIISLVFFVGDLFAIFGFPVNLPAPVFRAIASTLLVVFIFRLFGLFEVIVDAEVFGLIHSLAPFVYALVFLLVLILGYIHIFTVLVIRKDRVRKADVKKLRDYKENGKIKEAVAEEKKDGKSKGKEKKGVKKKKK